MNDKNELSGPRQELWRIIFGTDTRGGWTFDVILLVVIVASVINLMLLSVAAIREQIGGLLNVLEWVFTGLFTVEYVVRIYAARRIQR